MAEREQAGQELDEFERHLSGFEPRPQKMDRAELLFQAGQESAQADRDRWHRRERCWQLAAAAMALLACGVSWHAWRDPPQIVERIRYVPAPPELDRSPNVPLLAAQSPKRNRNHYLQQRYVALVHGLDELDGPTSSGRLDEFDNRSYRDLMDQFLDF